MELIQKVGRRKRAIIRIAMTEGKGNITVNGKDYKEFFPYMPLYKKVVAPLEMLEVNENFDIKATATGGGVKGQAEALQLAIARALEAHNPEYRKPLKDSGYLVRDPRAVERKKPGQPKARKKFQFSKR